MTEERTGRSRDSQAAPSVDIPRTNWWQRPTIRSIRRTRDRKTPSWSTALSQSENAGTRLADGEAVHLGALILVEAFTPSTVSNLYAALDRLPTDHKRRSGTDWREQVRRSRTSGEGGAIDMAKLRSSSEFAPGDVYSELPPGVRGVSLTLHYLVPSVAIVVATFILDDSAADLSPLLRQDHDVSVRDTFVHVSPPACAQDGPWAALLRGMPWARPAKATVVSLAVLPDETKERRCQAFIAEQESACLGWFETWFSGRFTKDKSPLRPFIRVLLTEQAAPFADERRDLAPVGLDQNKDVWRAPEHMSGWVLALSGSSDQEWQPQARAVFAARRREATRAPAKDDGSPWWDSFSSLHESLIATIALSQLVGLHAERLAGLRDRVASKRRFRHPVAEARQLDEYLLRDGLDVATFVADLDVLTDEAESGNFDSAMPPYVREMPDVDPERLSETLRQQLRATSAQLQLDTDATTRQIVASAELRQAITNTRLQRIVVMISLVALIVAVIVAVIGLP